MSRDHDGLRTPDPQVRAALDHARQAALELADRLEADADQAVAAARRADRPLDDPRELVWREKAAGYRSLADYLAGFDPARVDGDLYDLQEVRALAAHLVWRLGRLVPGRPADTPRRFDPHPYAPGRLSGVTRAVAYLRVSTPGQAHDGYGLDVQEAAVAEWARRTRSRVVRVVRDEGRSGTADVIDRPALAEALALIEAGRADALVVPRLDRLARDLILQEWVRADLVALGAQLRSADPVEDRYLVEEPDNPTSTLVRQILGAVAQHERAMIRLRMAAGLARKRAAGGYAGGRPPYGYRAVDRELVPDADEQRQIRRIRRWRREGKSLREIADRLNAEGSTPRGGRWHPQTVARVLEQRRRAS